MPSPRRMRLLMTAVLATVVIILFYTSRLDEGRGHDNEHDTRILQDFYHKTVNAMDRSQSKGQTGLSGKIPADKDGDGDIDSDDEAITQDIQERLKAAEQEAKDKANKKGGLQPDPPSNVIGVGSSAEGQVKKPKAGASEKDGSSSKEEVEETTEQHEAEQELNSILKKSPVIIFSKSYCPFSKRAKALLLEKYSITPEPYVVELDNHPLGPHLQDHLLEKTGRRTVPNIMINGVSIGGADDIIELDEEDKLVAKIIDLGNKHVEMVERSVTKKEMRA